MFKIQKSNLIFLSILFFGFFGWAGSSHAATPAILNVSGTVATGQTLTITGSNMIDENKTNWNSYFTTHPNAYGFEGISPLSDGYQELRGEEVCGDCGVYDNAVKLIGGKSIQFHTQGAHTSNLTSYVAVPFNNSDLWTRFYSRWNLAGGTWPDSHIKMLYDMSAGFYFQPAATSGELPVNMMAKGILPDSNTSYDFPIPSGQLQNNRWYEFEVHWKIDSVPHIYDVWMDNVKIITAQGDLAASSLLYLLFGIVNESGSTDPNFSLYNWMDGFAFGTSRIYPASTIEIGNSSNYATATKVYQEPIYLSDGSVQIKANFAGLGAGHYYLFVTNNQQQISAAYNLSGGGDTVPPAAPTRLSVN